MTTARDGASSTARSAMSPARGKTFANHSFAMPGRHRRSTRTCSTPRTGSRSAVRSRPTRFPAGPPRCCKAADRSPDDQGQYLHRVLAERRLAGSHHPEGAGRRVALRLLRVFMVAGTQHGGVPAPIRAPAPASTRATRTAPARRCVRCSSRSKNGSATASRRRTAACRASPTARWSRPRPSGCRRARFRARRRAPTASPRQSIGWTRRTGSTIFTARASRRRCRRQRDRRHPPAAVRGPLARIPAGTCTAPSLANYAIATDRIPFARTREECAATGDPRPSLRSATATAPPTWRRSGGGRSAGSGSIAAAVRRRGICPKAESCDRF